MQETLNRYKVTGIKTNIPLLVQVMEHEAFRNGDTTTDFIAKYLQVKK